MLGNTYCLIDLTDLQLVFNSDSLNFFTLKQKLKIFTVSMMLVCIIKLVLSRISPMQFINAKILWLFKKQQIEKTLMKRHARYKTQFIETKTYRRVSK